MSVVLILNSKKVPLDLQNRFGAVYPLELPVATETIRDYLLEEFSEAEKVVIVNACEEKQAVSGRIEWIEGSLYELQVSPEESDTLFHTVQTAVTKLVLSSEVDFSLVINYGDTIIQEKFLTKESDFIVVGEKEQSHAWDYVRREQGTLSFLYKDDVKVENEVRTAIAGQFCFSSAQGLASAFHTVSERKRADQGEELTSNSFYEGVKEYDETVSSLSLLATEYWLDFGHKEDYLETQTIVQARYFNEIVIDRERGILTKRSTDVQKFVGEINWYLNIPKDLQYLVPKIYDYSIEENHPFVAMEYYPYETIHNSYIYGNLDFSIWRKMIDKLLFVQKELAQKSNKGKRLSESDLLSMYLEKTVERLEKLRKDPAFSSFQEQSPIINGVVYPNLATITEELPNILTKFSILQEKEASIIHGDFCISNILLDVESKLVKLIDPRGKFGKHDIYGDTFYDIAKILHSFEGSYDHIITDNFKLDEESPFSFTYQIKKTDLQVEVSEMVSNKIAALYDIEKIRLIEGLLFLSMIPLHKDTPKRQKIMFGQAMKLLFPYLGGTL